MAENWRGQAGERTGGQRIGDRTRRTRRPPDRRADEVMQSQDSNASRANRSAHDAASAIGAAPVPPRYRLHTVVGTSLQS